MYPCVSILCKRLEVSWIGEEGGREREKKNLSCEHGGLSTQVCGCDADFVIKSAAHGARFMMTCRSIVLIPKEKTVSDFSQSEPVSAVLERLVETTGTRQKPCFW